MIAKTINSLKLGATDMKPRSFGCATITLPNKDRANDLVDSGEDAFISRDSIEKIGLIKDIPTKVNTSEIINESISPWIHTKSPKTVRTEKILIKESRFPVKLGSILSILLTFESTTLPNYIKVFGLILRYMFTLTP